MIDYSCKILKDPQRKWTTQVISLIRTNSLIWTLLNSITTEDVWRMHCTLYAVMRKDKSHQIPSQLLNHVYHFAFWMVILGNESEEKHTHGGNLASLVPRPLPDFISQPWRKVGTCLWFSMARILQRVAINGDGLVTLTMWMTSGGHRWILGGGSTFK